jgi:hypothetical protein
MLEPVAMIVRLIATAVTKGFTTCLTRDDSFPEGR